MFQYYVSHKGLLRNHYEGGDLDHDVARFAQNLEGHPNLPKQFGPKVKK